METLRWQCLLVVAGYFARRDFNPKPDRFFASNSIVLWDAYDLILYHEKSFHAIYKI